MSNGCANAGVPGRGNGAAKPFGKALIRLGCHQHAIHHFNGLNRVITDGCFCGQSDGIGTIEHGCRNVAGLSARWRRGADHAVEHLSGDDNWPCPVPCFGYQRFLKAGNFLDRHGCANVAACKVNCIGNFDQLVEGIDRFATVNFDHEPGVGVVVVGNQIPQFLGIIGIVADAGRNPVNALGKGQGKICTVFVAKRTPGFGKVGD